MNKNKLIALTIAAIYSKARNAYSSPAGVSVETLPLMSLFMSTFDYLRDKEGEKVTKPGSRGAAKIAKYLSDTYGLTMVLHFSKEGSCVYVLPYINTNASCLLEVRDAPDLGVDVPLILSMYRVARSGGKGKKARKESKQMIAQLKELAGAMIPVGETIEEQHSREQDAHTHASDTEGSKTTVPA